MESGADVSESRNVFWFYMYYSERKGHTGRAPMTALLEAAKARDDYRKRKLESMFH